MKRLYVLSLALTMIFVLTACSSTPTETTTSGSDAPAASASAQPAAAAPAKVAEPEKQPAAPAAPTKTEVPAGTAFNVVLIDAISTAKNKAGDTFMASLAEPLMVAGKTIAPAGTKVMGSIVEAEGAGRVKGLASMQIVLSSIMDGEKAIAITTKPIVTEAEATKGRDAGVVAGAAGVGAAIGALAGGKKGAGIGAIVGGGSGTGAVLATKGKEVEFDSESKLKFTLDKAVQLPTIVKKAS